jgi:hypothetical protein
MGSWLVVRFRVGFSEGGEWQCKKVLLCLAGLVCWILSGHPLKDGQCPYQFSMVLEQEPSLCPRPS